MKKAILFVDGNLTPDDAAFMATLKGQGYKAVSSNGQITKGFEDSCDKVFVVKDFEHIKKWCERNFIDYEVVGASVEVDDVVDEKPKRTRKTTTKTTDPESESEEK